MGAAAMGRKACMFPTMQAWCGGTGRYAHHVKKPRRGRVFCGLFVFEKYEGNLPISQVMPVQEAINLIAIQLPGFHPGLQLK
jgi:hypothetical protein